MKRTKPATGLFEPASVAASRMRFSHPGEYTPDALAAIMVAANSGDIEQLCVCGREILERNWDLIAALEQRADALAGASWSVLPGDDSEVAKAAAVQFEAALKKAGTAGVGMTFYDLVSHFMDAVVQPFAAAEIIWSEGGNLAGFRPIDPWHFTLRDSITPRLMTGDFPLGMPEELQKDRFVFHSFRPKSDPARQGKIRVLAWLHVFQNWPIKDLFSFIERFGMPFVIAKVDQNTWDSERAVLHNLIRSFGPSGGGVFTKNTEVQLLNASNTGGDSVYFRVLEFTRAAIYTLIVGQLASSSDSSGMSNGDAQSKVRQDILEADARAVQATVCSQIAAPWTRFHFPPGTPVPEIHFAVEPPEDQAGFASIVATLAGAGYKADPEEISARFGLRLTYEPPAQQPFGFNGMSPVEDATLNLKQKYDAMGVAIRAGLLTATPEIEAQTRAELGLPEMSPEVRKAWEATGGIRQPITLKSAEADAVNDALNIDDEDKNDAVMDAENDAGAKTGDPSAEELSSALGAWMQPVADDLDAVLNGELSDEDFRKRLADAAAGKTFGSSKRFEQILEGQIYDGFAQGATR